MKTALFTNFTSKKFTGYWDGKPKTFEAGQKVYMPDYLAAHFAKHLVNEELLRKDRSGNLVHKDGDKYTSPKKPEEVPVYMELFNKAFKSDETEDLGTEADDVDALIESANKNREESGMPNESTPSSEDKQDPTKPQVIVSPDFDEENDEEDSFGGKPEDPPNETTSSSQPETDSQPNQ